MMHKKLKMILWFFFMTILVVHSKVTADVIDSFENDFYKQHESQIVYLDRHFVANGKDGSVSIKKAPGTNNEMAALQNGEEVYIRSSCLYDGNFWGFSMDHAGWVLLDQMLVLYDYVAFFEDHFKELYSYEGDYMEIRKKQSAIAWPWPGADKALSIYEDIDMQSFSVLSAYKDVKGREWGFVRYWYGQSNIWICLSEPLNDKIPAAHPAPPPSVWVSETDHVDIYHGTNWQENKQAAIISIIIMVAALVTVSAVLIRIFWNTGGKEYD